MKLISKDNIFIAVCSYDERLIPKEAKFLWDPKEKIWWTEDLKKAKKLILFADDNCKEKIIETERKQKEALTASKAISSDIDIPCPEGLAYLPFQKAGIEYCLNKENVLISDQMGLGKSIEAIGVINAIKPKSVLVVCPASLKINWERELRKWLIHNYSIDIANGSYFPSTDIVICNYDILYEKDLKKKVKIKDESSKQKKEIKLKEAINKQWDLLIADEIHFTKRKITNRSQALFSIKAKKIIGLSGTPILNKPIELQPILEFLQPKNPNWKFWPYVQNFCNAHKVQITKSRSVWDFSGASKLSQLQEMLRVELMIRRTKDEVLKELPPKRRQIIELPQNGVEKILEEENKAWQKNEDKIASLKAKAELAKAESEEVYLEAVEQLREANLSSFEELSKLRHKTAVAKVPAVIEHIKDSLENEEKIVLFAHHHDVIDKIYKAFPEISVKLTGRDNQESRQNAVDKFQNDPNCKLFIGSITAAGVGLTLTASSHVIFAELDWVPSNVSQAESRLDRIGQVNSVLVQHLVFNDSLDAQMAKTIVAKQEVIDKALDTEGGLQNCY